ncbi:MAG: DnaD domain protein [Anaerolineae bacterium]|nr:DnaD domain protein [Anaerolineae bacterium]
MMTAPFPGFSIKTAASFPLSESFIVDLLPHIDNLAELKVTLFTLWAIRQREGSARYLLLRDFAAHAEFYASLGESPEDVLRTAVEDACGRGTLISVPVPLNGVDELILFVNDDAGRAAAGQVRAGRWQSVAGAHPVEILPPRPTLYSLYEQNIGALTPMIRDELLAAEKEYPASWIEEAMRLAVTSNKRNWRYVRAILNRWQKEGKQNETAPRSVAETDQRLWEDLSDFIVK